MTELKPCPFCGGEAYIKEESDSFSFIQYVARCKNCLVEVRVDTDMTKSFEYNRQKVIEKWNNRWMIPCEESETEGNWHTGTPTEEGWYLIKYKDEETEEIKYHALHLNNEQIKSPCWIKHEWQKIED